MWSVMKLSQAKPSVTRYALYPIHTASIHSKYPRLVSIFCSEEHTITTLQPDRILLDCNFCTRYWGIEHMPYWIALCVVNHTKRCTCYTETWHYLYNRVHNILMTMREMHLFGHERQKRFVYSLPEIENALISHLLVGYY